MTDNVSKHAFLDEIRKSVNDFMRRDSYLFLTSDVQKCFCELEKALRKEQEQIPLVNGTVGYTQEAIRVILTR